jgi:sugar O-acyltransferase (sialic acid O-acetyltransferase NeuD family)
MDTALILIGAGAHLSVAVDVARLNDIAPAGVIDGALAAGSERCGIKVIGGDDRIAGLAAKGASFHIAITNPKVRRKLRDVIEGNGGSIVSLIHPRAIIASSATIGHGCFIAAGAIVNPQAALGMGVVLNTGAQVDHDCQVGADSHIAPGAILCGTVTCGERVFIASGAIIGPNVKIGLDVIVGAGSTVLDDVPDGMHVEGTPARAK